MEAVGMLVVFIVLIGIKLAVLLFVLNKGKKKQSTPKDEDILDQI